MINKKIKLLLKEKAGKSIITDLRIGLKHCCVELDSKYTGIATLKRSQAPESDKNHLSGELFIGKTAEKLIDLLGDINQINSSVALATANALTNNYYKDNESNNILDIIECKPNDYVALIGYNHILAVAIKQKTNYLYIFEQTPSEEFLPVEQIENLIHQFKVIIISSDSIIDNSIDVLLNISESCTKKIIAGVSTIFLPEIFNDYGVTALSGIQVINKDKCKNLISHGYGDLHRGNTIKELNLELS